MNRDKIRESINALFSWACDTTDGTDSQKEVKQAYQSAITELQSDVAVMRKITPETKFEHADTYLLRLGRRFVVSMCIESYNGFYVACDNKVHPYSEFTHYLQIELEE